MAQYSTIINFFLSSFSLWLEYLEDTVPTYYVTLLNVQLFSSTSWPVYSSASNFNTIFKTWAIKNKVKKPLESVTSRLTSIYRYINSRKWIRDVFGYVVCLLTIFNTISQSIIATVERWAVLRSDSEMITKTVSGFTSGLGSP